MIKKIVLLVIIALVSLSCVSISENIDARDRLLEKYKTSEKLYGHLRTILKPNLETKEGINAFYNSLDELRISNDTKSTEILVDLLDFYIGEAPSAIIEEAIVEKGKSALPFLRKKLVDPVILGEMPNEKDSDTILKKRNKDIIFLMEHIYYQIPYAYEYHKLDAVDITRVKLFEIQKRMEKYYFENGRYPTSLNELKNKENDSALDLTKDAWNRPFRYRSGVEFYFLNSKGLDGLCDTQDDIFPPICTEPHKFP